MATRAIAPWLICHATAPRLVHGVCQLVTVIMSGQTILRPAPHMPVKSLQRSQNPSRVAAASWLANPHSGQIQRTGRPVCVTVSRPRENRPSLARLEVSVAVFEALRDNGDPPPL